MPGDNFYLGSIVLGVASVSVASSLRFPQALPMKWFILERAFDATPVKLNFGKLRAMLAPIARFWWRDTAPSVKSSGEETPWICLDYDEFKRRI